jgi:hypothetical protein
VVDVFDGRAHDRIEKTAAFSGWFAVSARRFLVSPDGGLEVELIFREIFQHPGMERLAT